MQDHAAAREALINLLHNPRMSTADLLRVVMLYNLRYQKAASNATNEFIEMLMERGASPDQVAMIRRLIEYAGADRRSFDLFGNRDTMARMCSFIRQPLKDVKNVYTQHTPLLRRILDQALAADRFLCGRGHLPGGDDGAAAQRSARAVRRTSAARGYQPSQLRQLSQ